MKNGGIRLREPAAAGDRLCLVPECLARSLGQVTKEHRALLWRAKIPALNPFDIQPDHAIGIRHKPSVEGESLVPPGFCAHEANVANAHPRLAEGFSLDLRGTKTRGLGVNCRLSGVLGRGRRDGRRFVSRHSRASLGSRLH